MEAGRVDVVVLKMVVVVWLEIVDPGSMEVSVFAVDVTKDVSVVVYPANDLVATDIPWTSTMYVEVDVGSVLVLETTAVLDTVKV